MESSYKILRLRPPRCRRRDRSLAPEAGGHWRLTQRRQQFAAQCTAGQHIERRIDGLGGKLIDHVVRIHALEASCNLLGQAGFTFFSTHVAIESRSHGNTLAHQGQLVLHLEK